LPYEVVMVAVVEVSPPNVGRLDPGWAESDDELLGM